MADAKVGLVTVTYNSVEVLPGFFRSLWAQQHGNFICVVVDNQSRDDSCKLLGAQSDTRLKVFANDQNLGVAEGNNQGIRYCLEQGCDYVLLINNDTEFGPELIGKLVEVSTATSHPMVVPKIYYYEPADLIWCAGGYFKKWAAWYNVHSGEREKDVGQHDTAGLVEYCPTCCMLVRADVFARIGLMDADYFVYYDDVDFCIRALKAGISLYYTPETKLWHKVSSLTGGEQSAFSIQYSSRNRALLVNKNFRGVKVPYYHAVNLAYFFWRYAKAIDMASVFSKRVRIYTRAAIGLKG